VAFVRSAKGFAIALVDVTNPADAKIKDVLWKRGDGTNVEPLYPVYSPERRRGVFVGRDAKGQALYTFEPGKVPLRLEAEGYDKKISSLALSPDGRYVLFCSDRPWPKMPAATDKQDEINKEVRERGGRVEVDENVPGKPVISVVSSGSPGTEFDDAFVGRLTPLTRLRKLHLPNTSISDDGLKHLVQFKELEHLDLAFTAISDAGLKHLEGLKTLKAVRVSFSHVTEQGVAALQAALPQTKIITK
jgi:hypothetical protein